MCLLSASPISLSLSPKRVVLSPSPLPLCSGEFFHFSASDLEMLNLFVFGSEIEFWVLLILRSFWCFRSKPGAQSRSVHSVRMEASDKTVPSIVVYVTVPNKEAGECLIIF